MVAFYVIRESLRGQTATEHVLAAALIAINHAVSPLLSKGVETRAAYLLNRRP